MPDLTRMSQDVRHVFRAIGGELRKAAWLWKATLGAVTLTFTLFSIIATLHVDAFLQAGQCPFLALLSPSGFSEEERRSLDELTEAGGRDELARNYVFVLDCSESINDGLDPAPQWYWEAATTLSDASLLDEVEDDPKAYDVLKVGLFMMLHDLQRLAEKEGDNEPPPTFSIWNVCGNGGKQVPGSGEGRTLEVDHVTISRAIKQVEQADVADDWESTDFYGLFRKLNETNGTDQYGLVDKEVLQSQMIVTILSDFLDDPRGSTDSHDRQTATSRATSVKLWKERRLREIESEVRSLRTVGAVINLVAVTSASAADTPVVGLLREQIHWHRLNEVNISKLERVRKNLLYPVTWFEEPFRFYLADPFGGDSFIWIDLTSKGSLSFDFLSTAGVRTSISPFRYAFVGSDVALDDINDWKRVDQGARPVEDDIVKGTALVFRADAPDLPTEESVLKISLESEGKTFIIPIRLVRSIPLPLMQHFNVAFLIVAALVAAIAVVALVGVYKGLATLNSAKGVQGGQV